MRRFPSLVVPAVAFVVLASAGVAAADEPVPGGAPPAPPAEGQGPVSGKFFDANDANQDGKVTKAEFLAQGRDEEVFALFDKDGDGVVTLAEVGLPADYKPKPLPPPDAKPGGAGAFAERARRFREELLAMDADKDGKVSREEYKGKRPFDGLDRNKDGFLSAEDAGPGRDGGGGEQRFKERDRNGDGRLTADEMPDAARFRELDKDGDGAVTMDEMRAAALGRDGARPGALRGDKDGDGKVSRAEFPGSDETFRGLDANGDGALTRDELGKGRPGKDKPPQAPDAETTPPAGGPAPGGALFAAFDRDRDGRLARNEFPGDDAAWRSLDADADGWITPAEAGRAR